MNADAQLRFLLDLVHENAQISRHVVPLGYGLWAIHGLIAFDGEVLMAEFDSYDQARGVLEQLPFDL